MINNSFKVNDLLLVESHFSRVNNVNFGADVNNQMDINVDVAIEPEEKKKMIVSETVIFKQLYHDIEQVTIKVKMVGTFETDGTLKEDEFQKFGRINGGAIIFPYIREHISNLSVKAGVGPIILPPVNFCRIKSE